MRSLRYQLKAARFPIHRDLSAIYWAETPLDQGQIQQLASAAFNARVDKNPVTVGVHCMLHILTEQAAWIRELRDTAPNLYAKLGAAASLDKQLAGILDVPDPNDAGGDDGGAQGGDDGADEEDDDDEEEDDEDDDDEEEEEDISLR